MNKDIEESIMDWTYEFKRRYYANEFDGNMSDVLEFMKDVVRKLNRDIEYKYDRKYNEFILQKAVKAENEGKDYIEFTRDQYLKAITLYGLKVDII